MEILLQFVKMSGAGNDFVVIDNMQSNLRCNRHALALALCAPHTGIGADGLLILSRSTSADFFMEYYNADGSYGGMCGNGGRCAARYAYVAGIAGPEMTFEALDYVYSAKVRNGTVLLRMKDPHDLRQGMSLASDFGTLEGDYVDTGSPHYVLERDDLEQLDLQLIGTAVRYHPSFSPSGCNVNVVKLLPNGTVAIRTYERGVEAETLACGTGCVAAAVVLARKHGLPSPITLKVRSGEQLRVYFQSTERGYSEIVLEGSACFVFAGRTVFDTERNTLRDSPHLYIHALPTSP